MTKTGIYRVTEQGGAKYYVAANSAGWAQQVWVTMILLAGEHADATAVIADLGEPTINRFPRADAHHVILTEGEPAPCEHCSGTGKVFAGGTSLIDLVQDYESEAHRQGRVLWP